MRSLESARTEGCLGHRLHRADCIAPAASHRLHRTDCIAPAALHRLHCTDDSGLIGISCAQHLLSESQHVVCYQVVAPYFMTKSDRHDCPVIGGFAVGLETSLPGKAGLDQVMDGLLELMEATLPPHDRSVLAT